MDPVRVLLVGLGGYGNGYVNAMLDEAAGLGVELVGAVDPAPTGCFRIDEVSAAAGTIHPTMESFFERGEADLVVISAPIHLHAAFTTTALEAGSNVLCEKPVAAVVQDALAMAGAERAAGERARSRGLAPPTVAIGYQWSFSEAVGRIRAEVAAGRFGVPLQLRSLVFWPRPASYYGRSSWAGALTTWDGDWVLDSPVNNATAHYLHNMLFVLGTDGGVPHSVEAELYRANAIESFDTAALRVETASGAEVLFYTTHAVPSNVNPVIHYRFSDADLYCNAPGNFFARFADGTVEDLGSPEATHADKLRRAAADIRAGRPPACSIADATHQSIVTCGAHESAPITAFPPDLVRRTDELTWVEGLQGVFTQCFAQGALPAETGSVAWAAPGERVDLSGYDRYPSRA